MPRSRQGTRTYSSLLVQALAHLHSPGTDGISLEGFMASVRPLLEALAVMWWEYDLREESLALQVVEGLRGGAEEDPGFEEDPGYFQAVLGSDVPQVYAGVPFSGEVAERLPAGNGDVTTIGIRIGSNERPHGVLLVVIPAGASLAVQATETVQLLGSSLSRALDGSLLRSELQSQVERLLLLHDLSRILQTNAPLSERLGRLTDTLTGAFQAHFGYILLYEERGDRLEFRAVSGIDEAAFKELVLRPGSGITGSVFKSGLARLVPDVARDPDYLEGHPDVRSELAVPIRAEGAVIGVLNLESDAPGAFDQDDLRLATIVANQIGATLQNALAYEEAISRLNEMELLNRITRAITTIDDVNELLRTVVTEIRDFFGTTSVGILLLGEDGYTMEIQASVGESAKEVAKLRLNVGRGITGHAAESGRTIYIPDVTRDTRYIPADPTIRSELAVPLKNTDEVIGILNMESNRPDAYGAEDRRVVDIVAAQISQILAKALLYQKMQTMAVTDGLTGLFNHRQFFDRLEKEFKRAVRYTYPLSLIMVDLDFFKEYNDRFGHMRGDDVLRMVAQLLEESVRETDVVARYGGEEFAVILPLCHQSTALEVADRIREAVEDADLEGESDGQPRHITVSVGICTGPENAADHEELVRRADDAMYASKRDGRNRCTVWNPSLTGAKEAALI